MAMKYLLLALALVAATAFGAVSSISETELTIVNHTTGTKIKACAVQTLEACEAEVDALGRASTKQSGSNTYRVQFTKRFNYKRDPVVPPPPPPPPPVETWTKCADEGQRCAFTGLRRVRYGAGTTWSVRDIEGGTHCGNGVFGDPIFGMSKECQLSSVIPTQPSPQPEPEPEPQPEPEPEPVRRSVELEWRPPTQNTDDSPLTDLAGYIVSHGATCDARSESIAVAANVARYVVENLPPGPRCLAVQARNAAGALSAASATVEKTIP